MWGRGGGRAGSGGLSHLASPSIKEGLDPLSLRPSPLVERGSLFHQHLACPEGRAGSGWGAGDELWAQGQDRPELWRPEESEAQPRRPWRGRWPSGVLQAPRPRWGRGAGDSRLGLLGASGGSPSWPAVGRGWCWGGAQVGLQLPPASPKMPGLPCAWGPRWALTLSPALL